MSRATEPATDLTTEPASALPTSGAGTVERGGAIGRYLVLALLGRGGMGEVYAAYDPELDRRVVERASSSASTRQR